MAVARYATGKHALGICDRCGLTFKLNTLRAEINFRKTTGMRVCAECLDPDHPQNFVGERPVVDGVALRNPRPDSNVEDSRELTGELIFPNVNGNNDSVEVE